MLDETYNCRTRGERTNDAVKDSGLGHLRARGRVHARTEVYVALCFRIVLPSPTTSGETSRAVRSYEMDSMTRSQE
jgi:hypothetical protein